MRALVLGVCVSSNAVAQLERLDPSAPQEPASEPLFLLARRIRRGRVRSRGKRGQGLRSGRKPRREQARAHRRRPAPRSEPAPHYFLGFGPHVYRDFSSTEGGPDIGAVDTRFGISLLAGGYFGGAGHREQGKGATEDEPKRRLGDKSTVALIGETTSLQWIRYSGLDRTLSSIAVAPGVDWFAADHLSLGAALTFSRLDTIGFESSGIRSRTRFARSAPSFDWASTFAFFPDSRCIRGSCSARETGIKRCRASSPLAMNRRTLSGPASRFRRSCTPPIISSSASDRAFHTISSARSTEPRIKIAAPPSGRAPSSARGFELQLMCVAHSVPRSRWILGSFDNPRRHGACS